MPETAAAMPRLAHRLLWIAGVGLDVVVILGLFADVEPERVGGRIVGAVVIAGVGSLAVVAAVLAPRRPVAARLLGLAAAGGMLFVAWLILTRPGTNLFTTVIGLGVLTLGAIIGWQLFRWRPGRRSSAEAEDGAHVP